jgi:hypothetical protein
MKNATLRRTIAILGVLVLVTAPTQAIPLNLRQVVQVYRNNYTAPHLELRGSSSSSNALDGFTYGLAQNPFSPSSSPKQEPVASRQSTESSGQANELSVATVLISSDPTQPGVSQIGQGDLEGTLCDCGEILVAGGGFPKWPFLFLGAIPFFFINNDNDQPVITTSPVPTPTPMGTPPSTAPIREPYSLILFATGLATLATIRLRKRSFPFTRGRKER